MDELKKYGDNIVINDYEISVLNKYPPFTWCK